MVKTNDPNYTLYTTMLKYNIHINHLIKMNRLIQIINIWAWYLTNSIFFLNYKVSFIVTSQL